MKVPVYKAQATLPQTTGASPLTVRASPGAMGASGEAQRNMINQIAGAGMQWYEGVLKTDRATKQIEGEKSLADKIYTVIQGTTNSDPGSWKYRNPRTRKKERMGLLHYQDYTRKILKGISDDIISGQSDKAVRMRLTSSHADMINAAMTQIRSISQGSHTRWSKGEIITKIHRGLGDLALLPESTTAQKEYKQKRMDDLLNSIRVFQTLNPFIDDAWIESKIINFTSDVGEAAVLPQLATIKNSSIAQEWLEHLTNKTGPYAEDIKRLNPNGLTKAITFVQNRLRTLKQSEDNFEHRKILQKDRLKNIKRDDEFDNIGQRISLVRDAIANNYSEDHPKFPKADGEPMVMPTESDIARMNTTEDIKDALRRELRGEGTIYNLKEYNRYADMISEAVTDDDLRAIKNDVRASTQKRYIGVRAQTQLYTAIEGRLGKTPEAEEKKFYEDQLKAALKTRRLSSMGVSAGDEDDAKESFSYGQVGGMNFYRQQIRKGARPAEAFWGTINRLFENKYNIVQTEVKTLPDAIRNIMPSDIMKDPFSITTDQVDAALEALYNSARTGGVPEKLIARADPKKRPTQAQIGKLQRLRTGAITRKQRLTAREMFATEQKLKFIRTWAEMSLDDREEIRSGAYRMPDIGADGEDKNKVVPGYFKKVLDAVRDF